MRAREWDARWKGGESRLMGWRRFDHEPTKADTDAMRAEFGPWTRMTWEAPWMRYEVAQFQRATQPEKGASQ